jgi:dTMP kinase
LRTRNATGEFLMSLIVEVEGISGAGKTTFIPHLKKFIEEHELSVMTLKEPGTTELGKKIRNLVLSSEYCRLSALTQMFLFLANRSDIYNKIVKEATEDVIIFDRFLGSTFVYQITTLPEYYLDYNPNYVLMKKAMEVIYEKETPIVDSTVLMDCTNTKVAYERLKNRNREELPSYEVWNRKEGKIGAFMRYFYIRDPYKKNVYIKSDEGTPEEILDNHKNKLFSNIIQHPKLKKG